MDLFHNGTVFLTNPGVNLGLAVFEEELKDPGSTLHALGRPIAAMTGLTAVKEANAHVVSRHVIVVVMPAEGGFNVLQFEHRCE